MLKLVLLSSLLAPLCFAADTPLLKFSAASHTSTQTETCEIFRDKVVMTKKFGGDVETITRQDHELKGDIAKLVAQVKGTVKPKTDYAIRTGTSTYQGFLDDGWVTFQQSTAGKTLESEDASAKTLRALVDRTCR